MTINKFLLILFLLAVTPLSSSAHLLSTRGALSAQGFGMFLPTAPKVVQTASVNNYASIAVSSTGAGHMLALAIVVNGVTTITVKTVKDSNNNSFISAGARSTLTSGGSLEIWYLPFSTSGATSVSVTYSSAPAGGQLFFTEVAAGAGTPSVDVSGKLNDQSSSTSPNSPVITTSGRNEFVFAAVVAANSVSAVAAPYTNITPVNGNTASYYISSNPGSTHAVWTESPAGATGTSIVAFRWTSNKIYFVQDAVASNAATTSVTASGLNAVKSGDFVFAMNMNGSGTTTALTDSDNGTPGCSWTSVGSILHGGNDNQISYCKNDTGGLTSVTLTETGGAGGTISVDAAEFAGVLTTTPLDAAPAGVFNNTATTSQITQSVTTTNANDVVVACVMTAAGTGTGFSVTNGTGASANWILFLNEGTRTTCAYAIVTATGTYNAQFTWTGSLANDTWIAAFKSQ